LGGSDLRHSCTGFVRQQRTHSSRVLPGFQEIRQSGHRCTGNDRVVVEQENKLSVRGPYPDIQCFRESEILWKADEACRRKILIEGGAGVRGTVIHHQNLVRIAQRFELLRSLSALLKETMTTEVRFVCWSAGAE